MNAKARFDAPAQKDWAFYAFVVMSLVNISAAMDTYRNPLTGSMQLGLAFLIDAALACAIAYIEVWIVVLLPRKIIRSKKSN